jgi:hypothetical protein
MVEAFWWGFNSFVEKGATLEKRYIDLIKGISHDEGIFKSFLEVNDTC